MGSANDEIYHSIIEEVFFSKFSPGIRQVEFEREELVIAAKKLKLSVPKNLGDIEIGGYHHLMDETDYSTPPDGYEDERWQAAQERLDAYANALYTRLKEADEHAPRKTDGPPTAPKDTPPD